MTTEADTTTSTPKADALAEARKHLSDAEDIEYRMHGSIRMLMLAASADHLDDRDREAFNVLHDLIADTWREIVAHVDGARAALHALGGDLDQKAREERATNEPADLLRCAHYAAEAVTRLLDDAKAKAEALTAATAPART